MAADFDRLPKELIIYVFEKILDARSLFMCYSACKQFAALVRQTRFVSLRIPYSSFSWVPVWPPGILKFLRKLRRLESATIHFSLPDPPKYPNRSSKFLLKWRSDSSGFIFLFCENCVEFDHVSTCGDNDKEDEFPSLFDEISARLAWMEDQLRDSTLRIFYVEELIPLFPKLKSVEAVDSMGRGRFVLDEQGISMVKGKNNCCREFWIRRWNAPQVVLPLSRCVMKEVTLIRIGETRDFTEEKNSLFEDTEYQGAAANIMKKYCHIPSDAMVSFVTLADAVMYGMFTQKTAHHLFN